LKRLNPTSALPSKADSTFDVRFVPEANARFGSLWTWTTTRAISALLSKADVLKHYLATGPHDRFICLRHNAFTSPALNRV
jgi:hypothetical protein